MNKETFYFSHDYNARNDRKMVKLKLKHRQTGIGIYWSLVEMLYEESGRIHLTELPTLAEDMKEKEAVVRSVIMDFGLFENDGEFFWSNSVQRRLERRFEKSVKARESAQKRWKDANALPTQSEGNAIKERKGKENKGKESNEGKVVAIAPDRKRFVQPTEIDLIEYFVKIGLDDFTAQAQAKKFIDCYETNGWKVGKSKAPMQNWKTAANGWKDRMNNYTNNGYGNQANKGFNDSAKPGTSAARIEALKNW